MISAAIQRLGTFRPTPVLIVRVATVLIILAELFVTAKIQLPGLMHPNRIGMDTANYFAAGQRLNAGHNLYGPLLPGDRLVPGYPLEYPAPLLSPPWLPSSGARWRRWDHAR